MDDPAPTDPAVLVERRGALALITLNRPRAMNAVNAALSRGYQKRGGGAQRVTLDEGLAVSPELSPDLIALDEALTALETTHQRKAQVVELRFFGGMSVEETAEALHVSAVTVMRDWRFAKLWLLREMGGQ